MQVYNKNIFLRSTWTPYTMQTYPNQVFHGNEHHHRQSTQLTRFSPPRHNNQVSELTLQQQMDKTEQCCIKLKTAIKVENNQAVILLKRKCRRRTMDYVIPWRTEKKVQLFYKQKFQDLKKATNGTATPSRKKKQYIQIHTARCMHWTEVHWSYDFEHHWFHPSLGTFSVDSIA